MNVNNPETRQSKQTEQASAVLMCLKFCFFKRAPISWPVVQCCRKWMARSPSEWAPPQNGSG